MRPAPVTAYNNGGSTHVLLVLACTANPWKDAKMQVPRPHFLSAAGCGNWPRREACPCHGPGCHAGAQAHCSALLAGLRQRRAAAQCRLQPARHDATADERGRTSGGAHAPVLQCCCPARGHMLPYNVQVLKRAEQSCNRHSSHLQKMSVQAGSCCSLQSCWCPAAGALLHWSPSLPKAPCLRPAAADPRDPLLAPQGPLLAPLPRPLHWAPAQPTAATGELPRVGSGRAALQVLSATCRDVWLNVWHLASLAATWNLLCLQNTGRWCRLHAHLALACR